MWDCFQQAIGPEIEALPNRQRSFSAPDHRSMLNNDRVTNRGTKETTEHTIERVVRNSIFIEPVGTGKSEQSTGRAIEWIDRARSVDGRLIDDKVQRTDTAYRSECINYFESPKINVWIGQE
jgi:hypothetical protein